MKLYSSGTVNINGSMLDARAIDASASNSQFGLNSGILAVAQFNGDLVNLGGTLAPGHSPGVTTINGDYTQSRQAALAIEIGGLTAGSEYDLLDVTGMTTLAGILDVDLYDMGGGLFSPSLGDIFDILSAEAIKGELDVLTFAAFGSSLGWQIDYLIDATDIVRLGVGGAVPIPAAV